MSYHRLILDFPRFLHSHLSPDSRICDSLLRIILSILLHHTFIETLLLHILFIPMIITPRTGKPSKPSSQPRDGGNYIISVRRDHNTDTRPQSDVVGSTLYVSHHLTFSQLCLQEEKSILFEPAYPVSAPSIVPSRQNIWRSIEAGGRGSVVRVVGSQLVTVLRDDRKTIRRSTLSAITHKFAEQRSAWLDDVDINAEDEGGEDLAKQREHRAKAEKVLALLQLEQEALEREEQEEGAQYEQVSPMPREDARLDDAESTRRERVKARIRLELDNLAAAENYDESSEGEQEDEWQFDQESITSSRWAWDGISNQYHCYREEMRILVSKFKEADAEVWRRIIRRHKHNSWSSASYDTVVDDSDQAQEPFAALTSQLRGGTYEILRLQAKRQHQLKECIGIQNQWRCARSYMFDAVTNENWQESVGDIQRRELDSVVDFGGVH
ncbi:hypothetical protein C8R41DRAFT_848244 [Lentinula lateritia]|uniref:Uncharacterized protein n=1 Tax=Lentinula lateritia TaxID=40482 RepID=A0ABQ8V5Y6_9AGAR|nr:hypothetical protein C8R41DRAFT_848244 [Lentinula lateritia]